MSETRAGPQKLGETLAGGRIQRNQVIERGDDRRVAVERVVPGERLAELLRAGAGFTHLVWGDAELRFAQQMHELEYELRASLVALYRSLANRGSAAGEELERLLRGDGPHGRPARLAGRLIRVLAELDLVSLDRDLPALTIAARVKTSLERSPSYRAYAARYEDGRRYLTSDNLPRSVHRSPMAAQSRQR